MISPEFRHLKEVWDAVHKVFGDCFEYGEDCPRPDEDICWKNIELYLVGGCVRDALLGLKPKDFDFCTNLTPSEIKAALIRAGRHPYCIGEKFGTIGFKVEVIEYNDYDYKNDWGPQWHAMAKWVYVEVTTYRGEKYIAGSRKPEVCFSDSLEFDLSRRDFTINAMALSFEGGEEKLVDRYASRLDIKDKLIKAVGESKDRFRDDPLRMLRAIRFANKYKFNLENNLRGNISKMKDRLLDISIERVVSELDQILLSETPDYGINLMSGMPNTTSLLSIILPEVYDVGIYKRLDTIKIDPESPEEGLNKRWKVLLSETGTRETNKIEYQDSKVTIYKTKQNPKLTNYINRGICQRMKFSKERTKVILGLKTS